MKKFALVVMLCMLLLSLCGCVNTVSYNTASTTQQDSFYGYFTTVKTWNDIDNTYSILYANDTHVMYFLIDGYRSYAMTPLYNTDGSLQIYNGGN